MANRPKTARNQKILEYWRRGYRQQSIANMFKMKRNAVAMVIWRAQNGKGLKEESGIVQ